MRLLSRPDRIEQRAVSSRGMELLHGDIESSLLRRINERFDFFHGIRVDIFFAAVGAERLLGTLT